MNDESTAFWNWCCEHFREPTEMTTATCNRLKLHVMRHAPRIAELERLLQVAQGRICDLCVIVGDIEQCRCVEGDSIMVLCDNPEADTADTQAAVEACGDYTGYELQRFYGRTWDEALHKAADCARRHYSDNEDFE